MSKISLRLFDSSFTKQLLGNLVQIGVRSADLAANDSTHENHSQRVIEREIEEAEKALRKLNDHELRDLGISRGEIAYVVRHGRHGIDPDPDPAGIQAA